MFVNLRFAPANATPKIAKEYVLPTHTLELKTNIVKPGSVVLATLEMYSNVPLNQIARHHFYKDIALDWASSQNDVTTVAKGNLDLPFLFAIIRI